MLFRKLLAAQKNCVENFFGGLSVLGGVKGAGELGDFSGGEHLPADSKEAAGTWVSVEAECEEERGY